MAPLQPVCHGGEGRRGAQGNAGAKISTLVNLGRMGVGREICSEECLTFLGLTRRTCVVFVVC